jgi:hypothetical protein
MRLKKFSNKNIIYFSTNQIDLVRMKVSKKLILIFYISLLLIYMLIFNKKQKTVKKNPLEVKKLNEQTDKSFLKKESHILNIVIPTVERRSVGFSYLSKTLTSLTNSFNQHQLRYKIHTFSKTINIPFQFSNWVHHTFKTPRNPHNYKPVIPTPRDAKILHQSLEWVEMMKMWYKDCHNEDIFLYMEDDFTICPSSALQIYSLYHWMKLNKDVPAIKFSFGLNGIIMRCKDIKHLLKHVQDRCFPNYHVPFPVDWAILDFYTSDRKEGKILHTYRYNLLNHHGGVSSVLNDDGVNGERPNAKCFTPMYHQSIFMQEKFQVWNCHESMLTPCHLEEELIFKNKNDLMIDFPFRNSFRKEMLDFLKIRDYVGFESCHRICERKGFKCSKSNFLFVNNCEWMKKKFGEDCDCEFTDNILAPFKKGKVCFIKRELPFDCASSDANALRICPCQ